MITRLGGGWLRREGRATDFDGSFPRKMARLVSETIEENSGAWNQGKSLQIDLLPTELSPTRLEHWVRQRAREGGAASKMTSVHIVSVVRDWGLKNLVNSIGKHVGEGGRKITHLTEAPVPGTTLEWRRFCRGRGAV